VPETQRDVRIRATPQYGSAVFRNRELSFGLSRASRNFLQCRENSVDRVKVSSECHYLADSATYARTHARARLISLILLKDTRDAAAIVKLVQACACTCGRIIRESSLRMRDTCLPIRALIYDSALAKMRDAHLTTLVPFIDSN